MLPLNVRCVLLYLYRNSERLLWKPAPGRMKAEDNTFLKDVLQNEVQYTNNIFQWTTLDKVSFLSAAATSF